MSRPKRLLTPALDAWRRRGDMTTYDDLWRAACWEMTARETAAAGQADRARDCLQRAAEIVGRDRTPPTAETAG